jgi:glycerophosphoryl diester phosphodiesterase
MVRYGVLVCLGFAAGVFAERPEIYFQAHRGGLEEVPENTLAALRHAWGIPGAVPEVDLRTTSDGVIVLMHDETPDRTTDAPEPWARYNMGSIPYAEVAKWDAGVKFDAKYAGERVPRLEEVIALMREDGARQIYLDVKAVDFEVLRGLIQEAGIASRVIFVHGEVETCRMLKRLIPEARTMTWLSGLAAPLQRRYELLRGAKFEGLDQLQFHLAPMLGGDGVAYALEDDFLKRAVRECAMHQVALQLRPFVYTPQTLRRLIDAGCRWYVTDAPEAFRKAVDEALALKP